MFHGESVGSDVGNVCVQYAQLAGGDGVDYSSGLVTHIATNETDIYMCCP